jgi:hypothetical protein
MNVKRTAATLILRVLALLMVAYAVPGSVHAQTATPDPGADNTGGGALDVNPGYAAFQREMYFQRFPAAREGGPTEMGGHDKVTDKKSMGPGSINQGKSGNVFAWPILIPTATSPVPTKRDEMINDDMFTTFGYPVSDTQFQVIQRYNQNRMLEQAFDPEKIMWASTATAGMQATSAANSAASASVNQAQSAIDFTKKYLTNFTSEAGNRWQKIRDQLFIPMAILLLLPGAVLAQVKAIVSQGSPVLGDTNPFEGILRSIIAIFLIPATFLVINYGIDVSNSITFTIADEYKRIFGTDMYEDAQCAQQRAFPVNPADRNDNAIIQGENPPTATGTTAWDPYEALTLNLRKYDPCAKIDQTMSPDERVRDAKKITRLMMNGANVGLTGTWNVMCAFQMAFLYYLWCMGPIAAALWVWPMSRMRAALPNWIEGVVTLCFWSLFWNTTVLLMACFRGVGDSGTVLMSALNFLANVCVKYAFDFTSLVSQGASSGVSSAVQGAMSGAGAAAGGGQGGTAGAPGSSAAGAGGAHPGATAGGPGGSHSNSGGLSSALSRANAQNAHSGVMGGGGTLNSASSIPGLTGSSGMPLSNSLTTGGSHGAMLPGSHGSPGQLGGTQGGNHDTGLPPGIGLGNANSGFTGLPASLGGSSGNPFSFASTNSLTTGGDSHISANSLSSGANALGLHMNNGHLQVNPEALHNLQNQMNNPNNPAHKELNAAMQALQHGDPRALQALAQQGAQGIGGLDPSTSKALGALAGDAQSMLQQGSAAGFSPSDMSAISAFTSGQLGANGQPALGFDSNGTLTNNLTGAAVDFSNTNVSGNLSNLSSSTINSPTGDPSLTQGHQQGTTFDPNSGNPTNQTFSQMVADGSMQASPTHGLEGLAHTGGNTGMPTLTDVNGTPLPSGAVDASGHFAAGFTPTGDVYALNANNTAPIAKYDAETHTWNATNAQGGSTGITMNSAGDWTAPTASGGQVGVTHDNGSNSWYTSNSGGNVVYDSNSGQLTTPQGVAVNYDGHNYTAQNDSAIKYNQDQNSFVSTTTGAPVATGQDGQWYAQGTGGAVALNTSDNNLYMAGGGNSAAAQVQYSSSNDTYSAAGGQVYYDNAKGSFEASNSGAPVNYQGGSWYASDTNNQIAYNTSSQQMEAAGSNAVMQYNQSTGGYSTPDGQISYNSSQGTFQTTDGTSVSAPSNSDQFYANNTNNTVAYDQQSQRFEAANSNQAVTYGQTADGGSGWSAAGTNGAVQYDTSTGTFAANNQAPVLYAPSTGGGDSGGTYYAAGTNGSVYYDSSAQTWAGPGAGGQPVAYNYDNSSQSWGPSQGGGGQTYQVDAAAQQQAQQYQIQQQQDYIAQNQSYSQQQLADPGSQGNYGSTTQYSNDQSAQYQSSTSYGDPSAYTAQSNNYTSANDPGVNYQSANYTGSNDPGVNYQAPNYTGSNDPGVNYQAPNYTGSNDPGVNYQANNDQQYIAQNVNFDQSAVGDQGGVDNYAHTSEHYHQEHQQQEHQPQPNEWGYQGQSETQHNPASSNDYSRPNQPQPQPRPTGGLNAFIPVPGMRPRQQSDPNAKGHPQQPQPHPEHPAPPEEVHKKGPMELGNKQGGIQTDGKKNKSQRDLLKESWAEYQEGQEPEEEV